MFKNMHLLVFIMDNVNAFVLFHSEPEEYYVKLSAAERSEVFKLKRQDRHLSYSIPMGHAKHFPQSRNGNIPTDPREAHLKFIHQFPLVHINTHVEYLDKSLSYNVGLTDGKGQVLFK